MNVKEIIAKIQNDSLSVNKIIKRDFDFNEHVAIIKAIAGDNFIFDNQNIVLFKHLILYFNGWKEFETVYPKENYSLQKGIMLVGPVGTDKTTIMKIFRKYCEYTAFYHLGYKMTDVRDIINYFKREGNIDKYTYDHSKTEYNIEKRTVRNYWFDDLGTENETVKHYGSEANPVAELLLYRYNIFIEYKKHTHFTTNLGIPAINERYGERISDRLKKMVNVIPLLGESRRK